jgi:hypothetical protein
VHYLQSAEVARNVKPSVVNSSMGQTPRGVAERDVDAPLLHIAFPTGADVIASNGQCAQLKKIDSELAENQRAF